jgi:signal transduction histidine kinase
MADDHLPFDRAFELPELLPEKEQRRIETLLADLLCRPLRLVAGPGDDSPPAGQRVPVSWDLETVAVIEGQGVERARLEAAARIVEAILTHAGRYRMAAALHEDTVTRDYEALQAKHASLQESEARYRALAANLEQRVAEQVQSLQAAQSVLYQNEKMASVGRLAAGMAHEINNPLAYITGNLQVATGYLASFKALREPLLNGDLPGLRSMWQREDMDYLLDDFETLVRDSLEGTARVAAIVAALKTFSNVDGSERQLDDINERIHTVVKIIGPELGPDIEVRLDLGQIRPVYCRPGRLGQVFYNLLLNGAQAMAGKGLITVSTREEEEMLRISFSDTGCGIPESELNRIFDPFFTTKDVGKGTGLGLSVSREILTAHKGSITASSTPGEGTTMTLLLPITSDS